MSTMRRSTGQPILSRLRPGANDQPGSESGGPEPPPQHTVSPAVGPIAFMVLLLVLATTSQGAFEINRWTPLALFALAVLIGALLTRGGLALRSPAIRVALGGLWGLAAWSMLSMLWAQSSAGAFEAGNRMILYAAIVTLPFALPMSRRTLAAVGWSVAAGIGAIAVYVLVRLLAHGAPLFLAGRLNGPVNYRNATALLFALPVWPFIIAAAAKSNRRVLRAGSLSLATLCVGLAFLTQSRGILLGLAVGGCLALAIGPDRVRRAWVTILVLAGIAISSPWLLRPFHAFDGGQGYVTPHAIAVAAQGLLVATLISFAIGMLIALFDNGLRAGSPQMPHARRAARLLLAGVIVVLVVGVGMAIGNPVTYVHQKWDQFRSLNYSTPTTTRLLTVGGQRYDLWRVALKEFESAPLLGVGADNYSFSYYRYRETNRNLTDPHSLVFALLSEDGAVGLLLLIIFLAGIATVMARGWRRLGLQARRDALAPAAAGAVMIGQSTVDWIWLIPGLTAIGLFSLAVAAAQAAAAGREEEGPADPPKPGRWPVRVAAIGALVAAALAVLALFLSDAYIQRARSVVTDPPAELSAARTAARLDPWSVTPHYLEASALETMGERPQAYAQLVDALSLEPQNSASLGVLGDFEARRGHFARARSFYRRALALNPLDTGLQQLSRIGEHSPRRH